MIQYLVILLDDTSMAYCHVDNPCKERNLIPLDTLKKAIRFGMLENMMIQYVYPEYELPAEYDEVIESIDHVKIGKDILILNEVPQSVTADSIVLRLSYKDAINRKYDIATLLPNAKRVNILITDTEKFADTDIEAYKDALSVWVQILAKAYKDGKTPQFNLITDRLTLKEMHNCGAGISNITLAPNGKFYLCQAFYYAEKLGIDDRMNHKNPTSNYSVGDLDNGIDIINQQLLKLDHAPLCINCDAYHCNRCIYLNQKLTWDNNTPSRQQCVMAHLERNAARELSLILKDSGFAIRDIKEIDYLDPFDVRKEW